MSNFKYIFMLICFTALLSGCKDETVEAEKDPQVSATEAYNADNTTVQVSSYVVNAGKSVTIAYEYGTHTDSLNKKSYAVAEVRNDTTFVTASIGGLKKSTKYYIRLAAFKEFGDFKGEIASFTTTENATPVIVAVNPKLIGVNSIQFEAEINPSNAVSTYKINYGIAANSLNMSSVVSANLSGNKAIKAIVEVTGLTPSTNYFYQVVATNASGDRKSKIQIVKTSDGLLTDADGNEYKTTKIGDQVWTTSNWASSKYADGTIIDSCFVYDNNAANLASHGRLYTYKALKLKSIAPAGWRVPTKADWQKLIQYLGGESKAGNALKDVSFLAPSANVMYPNMYNFNALPSGMRNAAGNFFHAKLTGSVSWYAYYWGMTDESTSEAYRVYITYVYDGLYAGKAPMDNAYSVRLIKE